jgi:hypothetical protein
MSHIDFARDDRVTEQQKRIDGIRDRRPRPWDAGDRDRHDDRGDGLVQSF